MRFPLRLPSLLCAAFLLLAGATWAAEATALRDQLQEVRALQSEGRVDEAVALLKEAKAEVESLLAEGDAPAETLVLAAQVHLGLEEDGRARELLDRALQLDPANAEAAFYLGLLAQFAREIDTAIRRFQQAAEANPGEPRYWAYLGDALTVAARPEEALAAYRRVLELDPEDTRALVARARHDLEQGERAQALEGFRRASDLEPAYWEAAQQTAVLLEFERRWRDSIPYYERAAAADPTDWKTVARLVCLHEQAGDPEKALKARGELLALRQDGADPLLSRVPSYTRDTFDVPAGTVQVLEHFSAPGPTATRYTFRLENSDGRVMRTFQVAEKYEGDELARVDLIHREAGAWETMRTWPETPGYGELKGVVKDTLAGKPGPDEP